MTDPQKNAEERGFAGAVGEAKEKAGKVLLDREDMLLLACDALALTYTYDEKNYE